MKIILPITATLMFIVFFVAAGQTARRLRDFFDDIHAIRKSLETRPRAKPIEFRTGPSTLDSNETEAMCPLLFLWLQTQPRIPRETPMTCRDFYQA